MKKRMLSILLTLCMVLMLCPVTAFADDYSTVTLNFKYGTHNIVGDEPSPYVLSVGLGHEFDLGHVENCSPYEFVGWKESGTGTVYATDTRIMINQVNDLTFDAVYQLQGSLAITVDGFEVGKTPADCTYSFESTIPGVTFSEDDIQLFYWEKYIFAEETSNQWHLVYKTEAFEAGVSYRISMNLDNKGLDMAPAVTVNGKTPEYCTIATRDGVPTQLQITCTLGTPAMPPITVTADFTTTVKQGGSAAPGETAFELELVNERGEKLSFDDVKVTGSVITNGKGSYKSDMTFTGSLEDLYRMLGQGAFVKQVDAGEDGWTVDDTVWGLRLRNAAERAVDDAAPEYTVLIFPATKNTDDGGLSYSMVDGANQVERMTFTNTYTKSTTVLIDPAGLTDQTNPQTGDNSHMALWFALLFVSGGLLTATVIKGAETEQKRRKRHE